MSAVLNQRVRTGPARDGGVIVLGVWCPTCREEMGPLGDGTCPFCNRRIYDEDALTARQAIAALDTPRPGGTMTATATAVCKIDGCDSEPVDSRGRYAGLCPTHKFEARRNASAAQPQRSNTRSSTGGGTSPLAADAQKIAKLAKALDRARATLEKLPSHVDAKAAFDEATRRASVSPTPENLTRVTEATKRLATFAPKRTKAENDAAQAQRALELALQSFGQKVRAAA